MHTQSYIGIDIGKNEIYISTTTDADPKQYPTTEIKLKDANWHEQLAALVRSPSPVVAAEPTGHHYLAPVFAVLKMHAPNARLVLVNHDQTANIRSAYISAAKTDAIDAKALAHIAKLYATGNLDQRGVREYDGERYDLTHAMRAYVSNRERLIKNRRRTLQQLDQLTHSIMPLLAAKKTTTYARAARAGFITPDELRELIYLIEEGQPPPGFNDGRIQRYLKAMVNNVPPVDVHPATRHSIAALYAELDDIEHKIARVEDILGALAHDDLLKEVTQRWLTVPNASEIRAAYLHAGTYGAVLNMTKNEFVAMTGSAPKKLESGSKTGYQRPGGYAPLKSQLWMWGQALVSKNSAGNPVRDKYQRLKAKNHDKAFYAARTTLTRILWGVAHDPEGYEYK